MRLNKYRPSPPMVVAIAALTVALGGTSYAAIALPKNSVGTKQIKKSAVTAKKIAKNAVNSSKVKNGSLLAGDFKAGQLPGGSTGPQGAPGPPGTNGTNATALYAQIESTAPVAATNQRGVTQIESPAQTGVPGAYRITFDRNVSQCVPVASISATPPGGAPPNGQIATNNSAAVPNAVIVVTYDATGAAVATKDFTVSVFC